MLDRKLTRSRFFFIPETKGIPLERMDDLFDIKPAFRAHGIMVEELKESRDESVVVRDEKAIENDVEMA